MVVDRRLRRIGAVVGRAGLVGQVFLDGGIRAGWTILEKIGQAVADQAAAPVVPGAFADTVGGIDGGTRGSLGHAEEGAPLLGP